MERDSPSSAPKAFRIWKAGANRTEMGTHVFSEASARALALEQAARGNRYSIDADHMSLNDTSPPEARKAVGWHSIEARQTSNGPELWAVNVEWTDAVRAGLEKDPPEWRYFSPAYKLAEGGNEIASYLNLALTNNPATHGVTALANLTQKANQMTYEETLAALMGDDEDKKESAKKEMAMAWHKANFPEKEEGVDEKKEPEAKPARKRPLSSSPRKRRKRRV